MLLDVGHREIVFDFICKRTALPGTIISVNIVDADDKQTDDETCLKIASEHQEEVSQVTTMVLDLKSVSLRNQVT